MGSDFKPWRWFRQTHKRSLPCVNIVAVKRSNKDAKFARDIVATYRSPELQKFFEANPVWKGYRLPDCFVTTLGSTKP